MAPPADMAAFADFPLQAPPHGQVSNFANPETRGPAFLVLCAVFIGIMWPILVLRVYSKAWVIRSFGWDDASAILAAIGTTGCAASMIWAINEKFYGPHQWDVRVAVLRPALVRTLILGHGQTTYSLTMLFAKLALLLLYYRIFAVKGLMKTGIYFGAVIIGCFYLACAVVHIIFCFPRSHEGWLSPRFVTRCNRANVFATIMGVFNLVSDLYLFILPLPVLFRLQMAFKRKLGITAIFLTGLIAIIASSFGLYFRVPEASGEDLTWNGLPAVALSVVEAAVGVICASAPYIPAFFRRHSAQFSRITHFWQGLLPTYRSRSKKNDTGQSKNMESSRSKEATPRNPRIKTEVLGSVTGKGRFLKSGRWPGDASLVDRSSNDSQLDHTISTRRDHYEKAEASRTNSKLGTSTQAFSPPDMQGREGREEADTPEPSSRQGYWDLVSAFRSNNKGTTGRSGTCSSFQTSAV